MKALKLYPETSGVSLIAVPKLFDTRDQFCRRQLFHGNGGGWFWNDLSVLHLLRTLFLLLLCQLHLRYQALVSGGWVPLH